MKKNSNFIIAFVFILVAILFGWSYVITSPQYSVYQMRQAVKERDYAAFQKYVDVETVSDTVIDEVLPESTKDRDPNSLFGFGTQIAQGVMQSIKPAVKKEFKDSIRKGVASGSIKRFVYKEDNLYTTMRTVKVAKDGEIAYVTIPTNSDPLSAKMRKVDDHWQIYEMDIDPQDVDSFR